MENEFSSNENFETESSEETLNYDGNENRPPQSLKSRLKQRNKIRQQSQQVRFHVQLRHAFDDADTEHRRKLDFTQWMQSDIRNIIKDGQLTLEEFGLYFKRIDANCDSYVSWNELIDYLMKEIAGGEMHSKNEAANFIRKLPFITYPRHQVHRDSISQICRCQRMGEYITLSQDSIHFWKQSDLSPNRTLLNPGLFAVMLVFEPYLTLAVATSNRRLVFFDLDSLNQLPVEISASPSPTKIKNMTTKAANSALKVIFSQNQPLYNIPTSMNMADYNHVDQYTSLFIIGDDQGLIEMYKLAAPQRRRGTDFQVERVGRYSMHKSSITQISSIPNFQCYASSSMDGTVKFWTFGNIGSIFNVVRVFQDLQPISCFHYSKTQKVLATCGISRDAYVWSLSPPQKIFRLGGHYNQISAITDFVTTTGEKYIITMTVKKEFRLWDALNYRLVREWSDTALLRPENQYTSIFFDEDRLTLLTASNQLVKWAEDITALAEYVEPVTHSSAIVGCEYTPEFKQIITTDTICTIKVWNLNDGQLASSHVEPFNDIQSDIATVTIDGSGRRLVTSNFKNKTILWNYNSGCVISSLVLEPKPVLITILKFSQIGQRTFLIRAGWDKIIFLYTETEKGHFTLIRTFTAHTNDISAIATYPQGLISGSVDGQIYSWTLDSNAPLAKYELPMEQTVECLATYDNYAFIGDSCGYLHIFAIPKLNEVNQIFAHDIYVAHALTVIAADHDNSLLFTADTLGYVKMWKITTTPQFELEPEMIVRCHSEEITHLIIIEKGQFLVSCGADMIVRVWKLPEFTYVGFFTEKSKWDIEDPDTWEKKLPCEKDPIHFQAPQTKNKMQKVTSGLIGAVRSLRNLPKISGKMHSQDFGGKNEEEEEQEKPLDFNEMIQTLEEFNQMQESEGIKQKMQPAQMVELDPLKVPINHPGQLQMSERPVELISTINKMIDGKQANNNTARIQKQKLSVPVVRPKTRYSMSRKSKRPSVFLGIFD